MSTNQRLDRNVHPSRPMGFPPSCHFNAVRLEIRFDGIPPREDMGPPRADLRSWIGVVTSKSLASDSTPKIARRHDRRLHERPEMKWMVWPMTIRVKDHRFNNFPVS